MATIEDITELDTDAWPNNVLAVFADEISLAIPEVQAIALRSLTFDDPSFSVGLSVVDWEATEYTIGAKYPQNARYAYAIDLMVKGTPRAVVTGELASLSKKLRVMLYQSTTLSLRLAALSATSFGVTERFQRMRIIRQQYRSGMAGTNAFVAGSVTNLTVETENHEQ